MDTESTTGPMGEDMRVNGIKTTCTDSASIHGQTVENTKATTKMIKNTGMVSTPGSMADNMKVSGRTESSMEKVNSDCQVAKKSGVVGKMATESSGLMMKLRYDKI